jgi:hypothetical protein
MTRVGLLKLVTVAVRRFDSVCRKSLEDSSMRMRQQRPLILNIYTLCSNLEYNTACLLEHRWPRLLKQQSLITVYCLPTRENVHFPFPFAANKRKFVVSVLCLQKTNGSCYTPFVPFGEFWKHRDMETWKNGDMETWRNGDMETWRNGDMEAWRQGDMRTWRHGDIKQQMEAQLIFLNPFTACSSCKQIFVIYPFLDKDTNKRKSFANGLNGLAYLRYD